MRWSYGAGCDGHVVLNLNHSKLIDRNHYKKRMDSSFQMGRGDLTQGSPLQNEMMAMIQLDVCCILCQVGYNSIRAPEVEYKDYC